jgi:hypothetical protein
MIKIVNAVFMLNSMELKHNNKWRYSSTFLASALDGGLSSGLCSSSLHPPEELNITKTY